MGSYISHATVLGSVMIQVFDLIKTTLYTVYLFASTQVSESSTEMVVFVGFSITSKEPELDLPLLWALVAMAEVWRPCVGMGGANVDHAHVQHKDRPIKPIQQYSYF